MKIESKIVGRIQNMDIISYNLLNDFGFQVTILNYGGIITDILVPDKNGIVENVVLKYKEIGTYEKNPSYFGAIIGRTAGRICEGKAKLYGKDLFFNKNYGVNQGHGGNIGFNKKFWEVTSSVNDDRIILNLSYLSVDGEENYPGNLKVDVEYIVTNNSELIIRYKGVADKDTLVNLTNHSYFNLSGNVKENILNHLLCIDSNHILELDSTQVPTGKLLNVENTSFDFRKEKKIGQNIDDECEQIKIGCGYDHTWLLNKENNCKVHMYHEASGRALDIYTDQASVVVYSMNFPDEEILFTERKAKKRDGICFETQSPPIGINGSFIEYSTLKSCEKYNKETTYKFYIKR
jgi:aldose 1-epimerase